MPRHQSRRFDSDYEFQKHGVEAVALVHALEWIARNAHVAIVVLFDELPEKKSPYDRILYGAQSIRIGGERKFKRTSAGGRCADLAGSDTGHAPSIERDRAEAGEGDSVRR